MAGLAGIVELYRMLVFMGIASFPAIGDGAKQVSFAQPQWGQALWALILALIWFWVASGFWNVRAYAWTFGVFITIFTLIWGFMALLFGSTVEAESIPWLLATIILLYLYYPGVREQFAAHEMARMTPEQIAAMQQMEAANAAAAQQQQAPPPPPPPSSPPPSSPPPSSPGSPTG